MIKCDLCEKTIPKDQLNSNTVYVDWITEKNVKTILTIKYPDNHDFILCDECMSKAKIDKSSSFPESISQGWTYAITSDNTNSDTINGSCGNINFNNIKYSANTKNDNI